MKDEQKIQAEIAYNAMIEALLANTPDQREDAFHVGNSAICNLLSSFARTMMATQEGGFSLIDAIAEQAKKLLVITYNEQPPTVN